jgi:hypothetical protein
LLLENKVKLTITHTNIKGLPKNFDKKFFGII